MTSTKIMIKSYTELIKYDTFEDRFAYLSLTGNVGFSTFGYDRYINQRFYKSKEWLRIRDKVIVRDNGFDLGIENNPIFGKIIIHHMNPITKNDILYRSDYVMDPEYLICVSERTHNAIHYGSIANIAETINERKPNDTIPWR